MERLKAQVLSAAWGLAAAIGVNETVRFLHSVIATLEKSQWSDPNGDR